MIYLLHIDTSGDTGLVALASDGVPLAKRYNTDTRNQAATINNMIQEVLTEAGIGVAHLSGVVVCAGPGSYTGLRIGVATAKALCYVSGIPLFLDNKLTLLANQAISSVKQPFELYVSVLVAREGEYFVAAYGKTLNEIIAPKHVVEREFIDLINGYKDILVIGDINMGDLHGVSSNAVNIVNNNIVDIAVWAKYGIQQYNCNGNVNLALAEPFYLKQVYTHNSKKNN